MSLEDDQDCHSCGSSRKDREDCRRRNDDPSIPLGFSNCPHCGAAKCCMCDMGDDVECLSCDGSEEDS